MPVRQLPTSDRAFDCTIPTTSRPCPGSLGRSLGTRWKYWVLGMETFPLKQFRDRYYDPGLLAKHLGLHKERPRLLKATPR
jgi:hypothetical protein